MNLELKNQNDTQIQLGKRIIVDAHNDTMMKVIDNPDYAPAVDIGQPTAFHIDIPKMIKGDVSIAYFAAFTPDLGTDEKNNNMLLASMNALDFTALKNASVFCKAKSYADITSALNAGKRIGIQTIEGAYAFNKDNLVTLLKQYDDLGVKAIAPVWNYSNTIGEGTLATYVDETESYGGLTELGLEFVRQMNALGIVIDVSHMNERTFWDVVAATKMPLIASHSGASSVKPHIRNLTDAQLKAIAEADGVINVVFCRYFIGDESAGTKELVDHIDYIAKLVGKRHVGLGSDFDGATMPVGLEDISKVNQIAEALEQRGYAEAEIQNILGRNNLRVLQQHDQKRTFEVPFDGEIHVENLESGRLILLTLDSDTALNALQNAKETLGLLDGCEVPLQYNKDLKHMEINVTVPTSEPYHVLTVSFKTEDEIRYFCTRIVVLK